MVCSPFQASQYVCYPMGTDPTDSGALKIPPTPIDGFRALLLSRPDPVSLGPPPHPFLLAVSKPLEKMSRM